MSYIKDFARSIAGRLILSAGIGLSPLAEGDNTAVAEKQKPNHDSSPSSIVVPTDFTFESRASFGNETESATHMRYRSEDRLFDAAVEGNYHSDKDDFAVGALKLKLGEYLDAFGFIDMSKAQPKEEFGLIVKPDEHWTGILGLGSDGDTTKYMGIDWQKHGLDSKNNIGFGVEGIDSEKGDRLGGYGFIMANGLWLSYGDFQFARTMVIGYPNKDGPSFRYYRFVGDNGFELNEFIYTPSSVGLQAIDFRSPTQSSATSEWESVLMRDTNPFRFRAGDLNQRGKELVFGIKHRRMPGAFEMIDTELVGYLDDSLFLTAGYGLDLRGEGDTVMMGMGRSTGSYYSIQKGDPPNFRASLVYNTNTGEFMPAIWALYRK
jgi:hypothetical protein